MVTDPQTHTNPQTGLITIHCAAASLAHSVIMQSNASHTNLSVQQVCCISVHTTVIVYRMSVVVTFKYVSMLFIADFLQVWTSCEDCNIHEE